MNRHTSYQLFFTTADVEDMRFYGETNQSNQSNLGMQPTLPTGTYRVVCGELFRLVDGVPPIEDNR